jgi:hypothetical protein
MQRAYFSEIQRFSNPGLWILIPVVFTVAIAPTAVSLYSQLVLDLPNGENPSNTMSLILILVVLVLMCIGTLLLFKKMKLVIEIKSDGVYYRYPPFILKTRSFMKSEIDSFEIRKYKPISEYSGWGIRNSWSKSGSAFNVKGNIGLQLYLKNGKKVLFGTQRPDALKKAMHKMMKGD